MGERQRSDRDRGVREKVDQQRQRCEIKREMSEIEKSERDRGASETEK